MGRDGDEAGVRPDVTGCPAEWMRSGRAVKTDRAARFVAASGLSCGAGTASQRGVSGDAAGRTMPAASARPQPSRERANQKGDQMSGVFIHPRALVETDAIGEGTRIWAFCHVLAGASIGRDCNLGDHAFVENDGTIGNECVVKNGVSIWTGVTPKDRVFVGPNAAFTNDLVPRARVRRGAWDQTLVKEGASIGANATLVCPLVIGRYALIGAEPVVTRDVPDFGLVVGNPARLVGYVCRCGERLAFTNGRAICSCGRGYVQCRPDRIEER